MSYRFGVSLPIASRSNLSFTNSGAVSGDFLFAAIQVNSTTTITPPAGWTLREDTPVNTTTSHVSVYWKVADGAEPASWDFTLGAAQTSQGFVGVWSGQDPTSPLDVASEVQAPANSTSLVATGVTTTQDNDLVIVAWFWNGGRTVSSSPGDLTIRHQVTGGPGLVVADGTQAVAGATGTKTLVISSATSWGAQLLTVKAAPAGVDATGTVTSQSIPVTGDTVTATAGQGATGVVGTPVLNSDGVPISNEDGSSVVVDGGQAIPVTGYTVTASGASVAGATGTVTAQSIPVSGGTVTATAGQRGLGTIATQSVLVSGGTVTATAGQRATGTVTGHAIPVSGGVVTGSAITAVNATGTITGQSIAVTGGSVTGFVIINTGVNPIALTRVAGVEPASLTRVANDAAVPALARVETSEPLGLSRAYQDTH